MIQPLRPMTATPIRNNTNFGNTQSTVPQADLPDYAIEKQYESARNRGLAKYLGTQFIAGAIVSSVFDGIRNAFYAIRKNPESIRSLFEVGANAAITGVGFVVIAAVFAAFDIMSAKKQK